MDRGGTAGEEALSDVLERAERSESEAFGEIYGRFSSTRAERPRSQLALGRRHDSRRLVGPRARRRVGLKVPERVLDAGEDVL